MSATTPLTPSTITDPALQAAFTAIHTAYLNDATKPVTIGGVTKNIPYPFPSPTDWRDNWIYLLMTDRFNNDQKQPAGAWDQIYGFRQGGTFNGIAAQLDYLQKLGVGAIWITPVLRNSAPAGWEYNYHGYGIQDFLTIDERFASDGTAPTAERELAALVDAAHARDIYVIFDIVINHSARVFDYFLNGNTIVELDNNAAIMTARPGTEPPIEWLNGFGFPRADWTNAFPAGTSLSPDDAVWPSDLQRADFFRRRGNRLSDNSPAKGNFIEGDFGSFRQLVMEYAADNPGQTALRTSYGQYPVLNIMIQIYWYLIAKFDIDGFRIDTVKYVDPDKMEQFANAMREFALSIGKRNFFTFGEIWDNEQTIGNFIGRNSTDGFGIDAALDYPLFFALPGYAKCQAPVESVRQIFEKRKKAEETKLSSHGEAGKYFVSFLDNHDQKMRFHHPATPKEQVLLGLAALFCLQGIPCIYYGTEQGLQGTVDANGNPVLNSLESVREALWGKPAPFDITNSWFTDIQTLAQLRNNETALQYGRIYFRPVSSDGKGFGLSYGIGGVLAFSRILAGREVITIANASTTTPFNGFVLADADTNRAMPVYRTAYSNLTPPPANSTMRPFFGITLYSRKSPDSSEDSTTADIVALPVTLLPMEVRIFTPANV
ncbi:MAG TPA: alpha-amylase family glycosyl hydrolase [Puia sp.]|jgi:glycosidase|nr:alpha-amylase family glycosyl hydrolase [Puia sp.]